MFHLKQEGEFSNARTVINVNKPKVDLWYRTNVWKQLMFSVKVSQGNSLEKGEMLSHMLSSNPTETPPMKFLEELSFNSISLALVSFFSWQQD